MSLLREEWAIGLKDAVPKEELVPCFLFESRRDCARHPELCYDDQGAHFKIRIPEGFDSPYLSLSPQKRHFLGTYFWSVADKDLGDLAWPGRSESEIKKDVAQWLYRRARQEKKPGESSRVGRAALAAKLRTNLKALAAYRILQVHKWNRLPPDIPEIDLYHGQREWIQARKRAESLIRYHLIIHAALCGTPRN
jgi:hypothetical protein